MANEQTIGWETKLYDNNLGSRLLFKARAGALRTLPYRQHFDSKVTTSVCRVCRVCRAHDETVAHIVLECAGLQPTLTQDNSTEPQSRLTLVLGFTDAKEGPQMNKTEVGGLGAQVARHAPQVQSPSRGPRRPPV